MTKIIGIVLVKNEDIYIQQALQNVLDFCDKVLVLDNNSTDRTYQILDALQRQHSEKIELHKIENALDSHGFIENYANTDTWIFAIDGDELYDSQQLKKFRAEIFSGKYNNYWKIFGNCIHVKIIDQQAKTVTGYMAPPSRSITKLYNFNAITAWKEHTERLHGTEMKFKENFNTETVLLLHDLYSWEQSPFRCLHMCFVQRSSTEDRGGKMRLNPLENLKPYFPILNIVRNLMQGKFSIQSSYKLRKYQRGPLTKMSYTDFI